MMAGRLHYLVFAVWVLALATTPFWATNYVVRLAIMIAMYSSLALSWNFIGGFTGYPSFSTAAFFGLGCYAGALSQRAGVPMVLAWAIATLFVGAFVVKFLALAQRERDLGLALPEVDLQGNKGQSLTLDRADHLANLLSVQQELSRAGRLVIEMARLFIGRYVQVEQKNLSVLNDRVGISDVGLSVPQRFDFAPGQNDTRLPCVDDVVVVPGAFVPRDRLLRIFLDCLCHLTTFSSETQQRRGV